MTKSSLRSKNLESSATVNPPRSSSAGGTRASTPGDRSNTPLKSSAGRSNSAARMAKLAAIAREVEEGIREMNRRPSTRKQRIFDGKDLKYMFDVIHKKKIEGFEDFWDLDKNSMYRQGSTVSHNSVLAQLFKENEVEILENFRSCKEIDFSHNSKSNRKLSLPQASWMKVDRKLRTIVLKILQQDIRNCQVLGEIQVLLLDFYHSQDISMVDKGYLIVTKVGDRCFYVQLSSRYRLLLHAVCQFYGCRTETSKVISADIKEVCVRLPVRESAALGSSLSLVDCLMAWVRKTDVGSEDRYSCVDNKESSELMDIISDDRCCSVEAV